jgi:hypothetical protein
MLDQANTPPAAYRLKNRSKGMRAMLRINFMLKKITPFSSITQIFSPLPLGLGRMSSLWLLPSGKLIIFQVPSFYTD